MKNTRLVAADELPVMTGCRSESARQPAPSLLLSPQHLHGGLYTSTPVAQRPSLARQKLQLQIPLHGGHSHSYQSNKQGKSVADLLSVAVTKTGPAELTPHAHALRVTAVGFGVRRFLAALVASGALRTTRAAMLCSSASEMSSTGRTTWGMAVAPLKERQRGCA
ncbi:hypothetical protein EYF80_030792 [Liparis tanakae]|uniref:Uncharacterized protein n=1 Tax=Liparis tanakae TaxID=230148 RepID=A0A4Z2GZD6_9TELE|nr:hypothetical protein EYF80_030792 [Liparis tanakae]